MSLEIDTTPAIATTLEAIEEMCEVTIPDLAVVLSPDVQGMALLLVAIRRAMAQLRWAADELEDEITKVMPSKTMNVAGLGQIEMRTGASRKGWDKEGLIANLTHQIAVDQPPIANAITGEVVSPHAVVEGVLQQFLIAATPSWKTTGLREFHIDPDEYCTTTWGRKTIQTPSVEVWTHGDPSTATE